MKTFCIFLVTAVCAATSPRGAKASVSDFALAYLYGGTSVTYANYLEKTKGALNEILPDYYAVSTDGNGNLCEEKTDARFTEQIHAAGMKIVPFLSNNWDKPSGIAAMNNRAALAAQVAASVYANGFDGVQVDIQNVSEKYRDDYTDFTRLLRAEMPDKEISVAVAANPKNWQTGWHGCYDYAALAPLCDYLMLMAYDESFYGSEPGPVASKKFVEDSIIYALKYAGPEKYVLGVPFYGRYWRGGAAAGGAALTQKDAESLRQNYGAEKLYDEDVQSARLRLRIGENDPKPKLWGGQTLAAGEYEIWYDDLESVACKLDLAKKYNLGGTGAWAMGQETPAVWDLFLARKAEPEAEIEIPIGELTPTPAPLPPDALPFTDLDGHWAKAAVETVYQLDWMRGVSADTFSPENKFTRAQAAVVAANVTNLPGLTAAQKRDFADAATHWAREEIVKARFYGFLNGRGNNLFAPETNMTREEFFAFINRTFQLAQPAAFEERRFTDLPPERWSRDAIMTLAENEIVRGYPDGTVRPGGAIARAEAAAALSKLAGYGINIPAEQNPEVFQLPR